MPQAPLPAPASRVGQVPVFQPLAPSSYGTTQPFNVLPYMQYPNMIDAAMKGLKLGRGIAALPQEGRENAYQYAMAGLAKENLKQVEAAVKEVDSMKHPDGTPLSAQEKTWRKEWIYSQAGIKWGEQAGTQDPGSGMVSGINYATAANNLGLQQTGNPNANLPFPGGQPMNAPVPPPQGQGSQPQGQDTELQGYQNSEYQ